MKKMKSEVKLTSHSEAGQPPLRNLIINKHFDGIGVQLED